MRFIQSFLFLINVYEILFASIKIRRYNYANCYKPCKHSFYSLRNNSNYKKCMFLIKKYHYYNNGHTWSDVCKIRGVHNEINPSEVNPSEVNPSEITKKRDTKKGDTKKLKFYDFSMLYKNLELTTNKTDSEYEKKECIEIPENVEGVSEKMQKKNGEEKKKDEGEKEWNNKKEEEKKNREETCMDSILNKGVKLEGKTSAKFEDKVKTDILVKDDPDRIKKVKFENIYDYSEIFKEREKRVEMKYYIPDVFQKFPKFKDNIKVIKDAILYLKFIEKGNIYRIKNVDKKTINSDPYDDLSQKKKNKGTKKNKIKLELSSIYNNINKEKNMKKRICKECCIKVDLYTKLLSRPLNNIYNMHKNLKKYLHPFQYSTYLNAITNIYKEGELEYSLEDVLFHIIEVRKLITLTGKTYAGQMKYLKTCRDIFNQLNMAIEDINIILQSGRKWFDIYNSYIKKIRKLKYIDITKPAIAILGCPNVGKSSLLNSITNAKSKILDYCFTTTNLYLGHYSYFDENEKYTVQIMDLPGLLNRSEDKRNCMEKLTFSSLKNLPSAVIYVIDPFKKKSDKYSSLKDQIDIRFYLRGLFPFRPWVDVITKSDLIETEEEKMKIDIPKDIKENALFISTEIKDSLIPLKKKINEMTYQLTDFLNKHTKSID